MMATNTLSARRAEKRSTFRIFSAMFTLMLATFPASGAAPVPAKRAPSTPPNLVLITLDTTRADPLGAWGNRDVQTPNLDALAARGTRFARCDTAAVVSAVVLARRQGLDQGFRAYDDDLGSAPNRGDVWKTMGAIYLHELDDKAGALRCFRRALMLEGDGGEKAKLEELVKELGG
jgi:tetratricopeptide (TPR) repeat protein